jgi:hypothetical protein
VIPRVFKDDTPEDLKAVQTAIQGVMLYPLSQFDGKVKSKDWSTLPKFPSSSEGQEETKWVVPEKFVGTLPKVLDEVPPLAGEESLYANIRTVWAAAASDPKLTQALNQAVLAADKEIVAPLFQFHNYGFPLPSNWTAQSNGAEFGSDYYTRLAVAKSNIFVNKPNETKYLYQTWIEADSDSMGRTAIR